MKPMELFQAATLVGLLSLGAAAPALATDDADHTETTKTVRLIMPIMDSRRGMELFVEKGCYTCHSVNGVGGEDATPLDAHDMEPYMNPFDLAARMWRMAPVMIPAQEDELGEQIQFTGDELASIVAFLHDDAQQHLFTMDALSDEQKEAMHHDDDHDGDDDHGDGHDEGGESHDD